MTPTTANENDDDDDDDDVKDDARFVGANRTSEPGETTSTRNVVVRQRPNDDAECGVIKRPRTPSVVKFRANIEEDIGRADADVDRADVWELPRTCDGCSLYILPGSARFACGACAPKGDEYDLCAGCFKTLQREEKANAAASVRKGKGGKKRKKSTMHAHPSSEFIVAEAAEEEDE
jgi:hypothetical protein